MRGRSQSTLELMAECRKICEIANPITVRGVGYRLFVAGLIPSMATKYTALVSRTLTKMREDYDEQDDPDPRYTIPDEWIVDDSREWSMPYVFADLSEYAAEIAVGFRADFWVDKDVRVIVMSEKATAQGLLWPVLNPYGVPFLPAKGFNSYSKMKLLARSIRQAFASKRWNGLAKKSQRTMILYVGDYDPSGM